MSRGIKTACGQRRCATASGTAEWTPNSRASYDAAITTPRAFGSVPVATTTGFPRRSGRRKSSTPTKKASMSTCAIQLSTSGTLASALVAAGGSGSLRACGVLGDRVHELRPQLARQIVTHAFDLDQLCARDCASSRLTARDGDQRVGLAVDHERWDAHARERGG